MGPFRNSVELDDLEERSPLTASVSTPAGHAEDGTGMVDTIEERERRQHEESERQREHDESDEDEKEEIDPTVPQYEHATATRTKPKHRSWVFVALVSATVLQGALLGMGVWLTISPVLLPAGKYVFRPLTLKSYNVAITVLGSAIGGCASYGVAVGARSYVSWKLHRDGITVNNYERALAISNNSVLTRFSWGAVLALFFLALAGAASGAIVGVFSAGTDSYQDLRFTMQYPTVALNPQFYANTTSVQKAVLYQGEDFDGYTNVAARYIRAGSTVDQTIAFIDHVQHATIGYGVIPAMIVISTFTVSGLNQTYVQPTLEQTLIARASTDNQYSFTAPAAQSTASCAAVNLTVSFATESDRFALVNITDSICGTIQNSYANIDDELADAMSCLDPLGAARVVLFSVNPVAKTITADAACSARSYAGDAVNLSYSDNTNALTIPPNPKLWGSTEETSLALNVLSDNFFQYSGNRGSQSLAYFLVGLRKAVVVYGTVPMPEIETYVATLLSIALSKLLATEGYYWTYAGYVLTDKQNATTAGFPTILRSAAYSIGPQGLNKLWLAVIAATFFVLIGSIAYFWRHPPPKLDPLSLVDVLVVAQNSPASAHLRPSFHRARLS